MNIGADTDKNEPRKDPKKATIEMSLLALAVSEAHHWQAVEVQRKPPSCTTRIRQSLQLAKGTNVSASQAHPDYLEKLTIRYHG